jgi:type IX secretion system PorP/SprF family membrane protein
MIRRRIFVAIAAIALSTPALKIHAQSMHFSQYYHAPLLQNPANTGLMSDADFRVGMNYRQQWSNIVPYTTFSGFADFQALRNVDGTAWMGLGLAAFSDRAGDGRLGLNRFEGSLAYHIVLSESSMISGGLSGGYLQRSLNYDKLTFNEQWQGRDGITFNPVLPNQEQLGTVETEYYSINAGVNYALFPNEFTYIKIGAGVSHINQPAESFYNKDSFAVTGNKLGIRPIGSADALLRVSEILTINPSVYYTMQKNASELLFGSLGMIYVGNQRDNRGTEVILGAFYRWKESAIGVVGVQFNSLRITTSYDYTVSSFSKDNNSAGALEFAINYQGLYGSFHRDRRVVNCPRF